MLDDKVAPGVYRVENEAYVRKLLERRDKFLARFNFDPSVFELLDMIEQERRAGRPATPATPPATVGANVSRQIAAQSPRKRKPTSFPDRRPLPVRPKRRRYRSESDADHLRQPLKCCETVLCSNCCSLTPHKVCPGAPPPLQTSADPSQASASDTQQQQQQQPIAQPASPTPPAPLEPWESGATEPAPPATPRRARGKGGRPPRAWLRFTKRYVHKRHKTHLFGKSNMRYRNKTFAEHCHHATVDWDNHPFCADCYVFFDLPICSKEGPIPCTFCDMNSFEVDAKRATRIRERHQVARAGNRDIPMNCYTQ